MVYYKPVIINGQLKYITLGSRELRIYNGVPGKGKETRTLGRDRRDPSGHDPPPGWLGGISESKIGMACCLCAGNREIGGSPPTLGIVDTAQMPRNILGRRNDDLLGPAS